MRGKMEEKEVLRDYHEWLVSLVDTPDRDFERSYTELMDILDTVEYRWTFEKDQNRAMDGIDLRGHFSEEFGAPFGFRNGVPCTVLECLVAVFTRYSDTILCEKGDPSVAPELFFDGLESLGLLEFDDSKGDFGGVFVILDTWLASKITLFHENNTDLFMQIGKYWMARNPVF